MQRASIGGLALFVSVLVSVPAATLGQSETRERQAAAEAYDQGTASYLSGDYPKAAEWFETANRLSPAAPALIQAARAHQQAGHATRAATLALRLTLEYPDEAAAVKFAQGVLDQLEPRFVRVEVTCASCSLDVDGTLQESQIFFVEPGAPHNITASFETGERKQTVAGAAGETKTLEFEAPPRPIAPPAQSGAMAGGAPIDSASHKPLGPPVTFIAGGITVLLLAGSIVSTIDMNAGVEPYEEAVDEYNQCLQMAELSMEDATGCNDLYQVAQDQLDEGKSKETRTTILWSVTGGAAVVTAVIGLLLTDWSGNGNDSASATGLQFLVAPTHGGATLSMKGRL
jgi:tetratricopeptide (TPR) repeat protein